MKAGKTAPASLKAGQRFIPYKMFNGIFIPNVLLESALLSPTEMIIYGRLCQFGGENGVCFPSLSTIANKTSTSRSGAIKSINNLVDKGFLEKQAPDAILMGQQCTNQYFFLLHPIFLEAFRSPSPLCELGQTPSSHSGPPLGYRVDQASSQSRPKEIHKKNQNKTTTTTVASGGEEKQSSECCGCGFSLSDDQERCIELTIRQAVAEGRINTTPERYRLKLIRCAQKGELDLSPLKELERWNNLTKSKPCDIRELDHLSKNKEKLLDELALETVQAKAWWADLSDEHPAKNERPHIPINEDLWLRQQYKKYSQGESV